MLKHNNKEAKNNCKCLIPLEVTESEWISDLHNFQYSIFLCPKWINAMQNEYCKAIFLNFIQNNEIVGKISGLVCEKGKINGKQIYFYASPALKEYEQNLYDACHVALYQFAQENRFTRVVLGSYDQQHPLICKAPNFISTERFEYVLNLEKEIKFNRRFKRNLQHAKNFDLHFFHDNSEENFNTLFNLLSVTKNYRVVKYGSDYNPLFLFNLTKESLHKMLNSDIEILYGVSFENEVNSVLCCIVENKRIYGLLLGSDEKSYELEEAVFLTANVLFEAKEQGYRYYNPGGGNEKGLEEFKHSMGAEKTIVHGSTTNFIIYPQKLLNPLMNLGRKIPQNNKVVQFLKKIIYN